jgi:membrane-associated phospholipid phosphatase
VDRDDARVLHRTEVMLLVSGLVVLVVSALSVRDGYVSGVERAVFRRINDLPDLIYRPVEVVMQLGNVAAVGLAAAVAMVFGRYRLALGMALAGFGAYFASKVVKNWVDRGRPAALLTHVDERGAHAGGLGYVSGHTAVAFALVTVVTMWLSPRWRAVAWIAATVVAFARIYVGAHLPMDVVGGAALGVACGSLARIAVGARGHGHQRAVAA